jgi:hypothetical protein
MRRERIFYILGLAILLFVSCNLSDFKLDRLVYPSGLNPVLYRPFSSGSYVVKDYTTFPWSGNTIVTTDPLNFNVIHYPLTGVTLYTTGMDSMVVIVKTVNETPMKYRYILSFNNTDLDSGPILLKEATTDSQGNVISASRDSIEYKLNPADVINLANATLVDLAITLHQPGTTPVVANALKFGQISFKTGFRAPINLFKIQP